MFVERAIVFFMTQLCASFSNHELVISIFLVDVGSFWG
jgi:hypothetical protein